MSRVKLESINKFFGKNHVVKDFNLDIEDGEFIVLLGPSGCGKSTTLRMVAGLDEISTGNLFISGKLVNDIEPQDRNLAMVFQSYALYPHMTVYENISFSLRLAGMKKAEIGAKVRKVADMLQLSELFERKPSQLSGGQRQRVAMGRAMVRSPQLFLFDEPLSNLDTKLRAQMRMELKQIHAALKTTTIYVTHDQIEAMTLADRVVIMRDGVIEQVGTPTAVFLKPASEFVAGFIGSPSMNLFEAIVKKKNDSYVISSGDINIDLPERYKKMVNLEQKVKAGVRPSDLFFTDTSENDSSKASFEAQVIATEIHGADVLVKIKAAGNDFHLQVPLLQMPKAGDIKRCSFEFDSLHLFSQPSGAALATY